MRRQLGIIDLLDSRFGHGFVTKVLGANRLCNRHGFIARGERMKRGMSE
jgi:hypothetical protein